MRVLICAQLSLCRPRAPGPGPAGACIVHVRCFILIRYAHFRTVAVRRLSVTVYSMQLYCAGYNCMTSASAASAAASAKALVDLQ